MRTNKKKTILKKISELKGGLQVPIKEIKIGETTMLFFQIGAEPYYIKVC